MKDNIEEISIEKIRPSPWKPRESFDEEKMKELADSLIAQGIIQPIVVRKDKNTPEEYEIIAGERRWRACKLVGKETIPAIIKDVDDFAAREMSLVENYQRMDLKDAEKETYFNDLWEDGFKAGRYTRYEDMGRQIGLGRSMIARIIVGYKDRNSLKTNVLIVEATTTDLINTAGIRDSPDVRENLLKIRVEQPEKLTKAEMQKVVQAFKQIPPDKRSEIVSMVDENKLQAKDVPQFVETLKQSPPDIQEKLINQEITLEEAEKVNIFDTPEQREQVIRERKGAERGFEDQKERDLNVRKRQAERLKEGTPEALLLRDIKNWRKKYPEDHRELGEELYVRSCEKLFMDSIFYNPDHILEMVNKERQNKCIEIGKRLASNFSQAVYIIQQKMLVQQKISVHKKPMVMIA